MSVIVEFDLDAPSVVKTVVELDAVLDQVEPGSIAQLSLDGDEIGGILAVGLDSERNRGVLYYFAGRPEGAFYSRGTEVSEQEILYYIQDSDTPFPPTAEIPYADARQAARDYLVANSDRPDGVTWQWQSLDEGDAQIKAQSQASQ